MVALSLPDLILLRHLNQLALDHDGPSVDLDSNRWSWLYFRGDGYLRNGLLNLCF